MFFVLLFLLALWVVTAAFWVWIQIVVWREDRGKKKYEIKFQGNEGKKGNER